MTRGKWRGICGVRAGVFGRKRVRMRDAEARAQDKPVADLPGAENERAASSEGNDIFVVTVRSVLFPLVRQQRTEVSANFFAPFAVECSEA